VLEFGCGVGYMTKHIAKLPGLQRLISTDISKDALQIVQANTADLSSVTLCQVNAQAVPFSNDIADIVVAIDVIEHLAWPESFFEEAFRVLRPGGIMMVATPNPSSLGRSVKADGLSAPARDRENDKWLWFGFRDPTHINIRSISRWRELSRSVGFETVRDGTDFLWDAPYFKGIPVLLQELVFKGMHRVVTVLFCFLPWTRGENYIAVYRKPVLRG
jgi:SAM-dependent methyltransferase